MATSQPINMEHCNDSFSKNSGFVPTFNKGSSRLFSSPKGSFNALIYLHRYTPDTVSIVLNEYLRELMTKLSTRIKHLIEENNRADISNADKTRNLKQIDKYTAQLAELEDYERDVIFPLAQQKIAIDLDDGVKVNYCKFGAALKKIPGLEAKEE